jgi:hypothetical protein
MFHFGGFSEVARLHADVKRILSSRQSLRDAKLACNRGGAAEARGAHNPEVMGSIPVSGIIHWIVYRTFPSIST